MALLLGLTWIGEFVVMPAFVCQKPLRLQFLLHAGAANCTGPGRRCLAPPLRCERICV